MQHTRAYRARSLRWLGGLGVAAALMAGCAVGPPADPAPPADYDFNSASLGKVSLTIEGLADEPVVVNADLPGRSIGSWDGETGDLTTQLTFQPGSLPVAAPGLSVGVGYFLQQNADATGNFDPVTGVGSLSVDLNMTVASVDLGSGPVPIGQPCLVGLSLHMSGGIDVATKVLHVHQDGFAVTPPPGEACDGLGETIGALLGGPVNSMDLTFSVASGNEPPPPVEFNSASTGALAVTTHGFDVDPLDITTALVGTADGTWDPTTGALSTALSFDDGRIGVELAAIGHLWVGYHLTQASDATGTFDPATGAGTLTANLVLHVTSWDQGTELAVGAPCDVGVALTLGGAIDPATDVLSVSQTGFSVTGPAAADCDGSGELVGTLFSFPENAASLSFSVAPN